MNKISTKKIFFIIVSIALIISFIGFTTSAESDGKRHELPDGPSHSNELTLGEDDTVTQTAIKKAMVKPKASSSSSITSSISSVSASQKILIVTSGYGPLTGISPIAEKDYWDSIIQNMGLGAPDWYDGTPSTTLLNQYDLVIFDAGGYWYPLSNDVDALWDYHFAGKPLIVVAPDINYDWGNIKTTNKPTFIEDVLHIEGVLGILPEASFEVIANTGHEIVKSIPTNQHIPVASQSSWPDAFDPSGDGEPVLTQGFISVTEFGVGTSSGLPAYSPYDPQGSLFSVVAYLGTANEGRTVTFGFPPTAMQDSAILDTLARSTISWALGAKKNPVTLYIEDAPNGVKVNKAPGDIIDIIEVIENQESSSQDIDVRLEIPFNLFGNPNKVFLRDSFTDTSESNTIPWVELTDGVYSTTVNLESNIQKQVVWRFEIPDTVSPQDNFKLTGQTYANGLISSSDYSLIKIVKSAEAIIITNRKLLFDKFGATETHKNDVKLLLNKLYEISDGNSAGEKNAVVCYVDRYSNVAENWDQQISYLNLISINEVALDIDSLIENKQKKLHPPYLMIVGGDEIIPFYRVFNYVDTFPELSTKNLDPDDPVLSIYSHNYFPTDNVYADIDPFSRWDMSTPDLSTGRISAASAKDMRQLISNGISSPAKINNAVVASLDALDVDTVVMKLNEKNINILNDKEEPITVESNGWRMDDLKYIISQNDFEILSIAAHANYYRITSSDKEDYITPNDIGDFDKISKNKPFVSLMGCHAGLVTDQDGSTWKPEWDDNLMWAFANKGVSGVLASGSFVSSSGPWTSSSTTMIHGEQLYNDFFEHLITGSETTRSVGKALKRAENNYKPGWVESGNDKKAVLQYFIFGVPWMQLDPPVTFDAEIINSNVIISSTSPIKIEDNTYKKTFEIDISDYSISSVDQFDLIIIEESQLILSDLKPILPKVNIEVSLPHESNIKDVKIIPTESISLGNLNIPSFQSSVIENMPNGGLTSETDVSGLFPTPRFVVHTSKMEDHELVTIGIAPVQYDTITHEANFFSKTVLEITYETPSPVVITELTTDKPAYNLGETVTTTTSIENVGAESMTGIHLDLTLNDMVGQVLSSTSGASFDLPVSTFSINTDISTNGLPQGSYLLEVIALDNTNTPRAASSIFIYISSGRISNFLITPNPVIQGDDVTFEFTFENFAPYSVEANGAVHIYNKAGVEVANLPTAPIIVDVSSMKTIDVTWNTKNKDIGDYTALATISTSDNSFGPLFGVFEILSLDITPPMITNVGAESDNNSAEITWDTDEVSDSLVRYGTSSGSHPFSESGSEMVLSHSITLTGLTPDTLYYYVVSSTDAQDNSAESSEFTFRTMALSDTEQPVIESVTLYPANTTAGSTIDISVSASDNVGVDEVTADGTPLTISDGLWQGSITAPSTLGDYTLLITAKDAAGNTAEASAPYRVVLREGGASVSVAPRANSAASGSTVAINIKVKNTQNIDDVFRVHINVSELPSAYQADLAWFEWTEKVLNVRSGEEMLVPMNITIPSGVSGTKVFRAKANSMTSTPYAFDTGYLMIS